MIPTMQSLPTALRRLERLNALLDEVQAESTHERALKSEQVMSSRSSWAASIRSLISNVPQRTKTRRPSLSHLSSSV
jgi:hypothetical protein